MTTHLSRVPSPLASYNSLADEHLSEHLSKPRTLRHLRRMGLVSLVSSAHVDQWYNECLVNVTRQITRDGRIVDEGTIRVNNALKEHKSRSKGVLANSIVTKAIEMEVSNAGIFSFSAIHRVWL